MSLKKEYLLDIPLDIGSMNEFVLEVDKKINLHKGSHIIGVNADKINQLQKYDELKRIVKNADIIHPDGVSMVFASKILKKDRIFERIAGIDLMQELLYLAEKKNYTVYFLGAKEEVLEKMQTEISSKYPGLIIVGSRNGYFDKKDWKQIATNLANLKPDLVFVGITSPKKEYLIEYLLANDVHSVFMGVGGSFDVLSGNKKRAPLWLQKMNLEWLFRLIQEPKRLFLRYFIGNLKFLKSIVHEKIKT